MGVEPGPVLGGSPGTGREVQPRRPPPDDPRPMTIDGDSANALRAALAEVHAAGDPAELLSTARDDSCRGGLQPSGIVGVMALGPGGTM